MVTLQQQYRLPATGGFRSCQEKYDLLEFDKALREEARDQWVT